ncbi:hypothetical protein L2E82_11250 [Cichorium intybus]|uniref:Uncharacterized protein n=1 Tax=Cichorium intybus TaxID=13427 RepID=A0ACB9GE13_CICIN|nr:hypothetical protein L2E82_11250 [Cichorium intybus]
MYYTPPQFGGSASIMSVCLEHQPQVIVVVFEILRNHMYLAHRVNWRTPVNILIHSSWKPTSTPLHISMIDNSFLVFFFFFLFNINCILNRFLV